MVPQLEPRTLPNTFDLEEEIMHRALRLLMAVSAAVSVWAAPAGVWAQTPFPSKPLRLVVPFPAGGGVDIVARLIGAKLGELLGQPVVIEQRPGASATIGPDLVARSAPDGHTVVIVTSTFAMTPAMQKVPYDPVRDFTPVTLLAAVTNVLMVHPSLPARNLKELIALAQARPGQLAYATSGNGSVPHLTTELLRTMVPPMDIVHVPYKGNAQALAALLSGEISMSIVSLPSAMAHMTTGRLRAIGVTTADRSAAAPDVPTLAESGAQGYDFASEWGLLLPAKVPREIVNRLHADVSRVLKMPDVVEKLETQGAEVIGVGPEDYARRIRNSLAQWENVVRKARIRPE
jgi:tripartite-type tricarboxylate transporter receptor subunit TctC